MKILYETSKTRGSVIAPVLRRLILSWLTAVTIENILCPVALSETAALGELSTVRIVLVTAVVFGLLWLAARFLPASWERWAMAVLFGLLAEVSLYRSFTWPFLIACLLVLAVLVLYALCGWDGSKPRITPSKKQNVFFWLAAVGAVLFFLFVSVWTVCRVYSFGAPTYDFGIFAQMFHSMKTTLQPITTVERDGALSHFAVHVSPIYYLLLPFYCLVPKPATLQVLQAAVLATAVIPLWKLGRRHGLSPLLRFLVCLLLLVYPAFAGGASYDIHENAFLTPLILWLFYGIDCRRGLVAALAAILTLMVKEDAAVYVAVIALWLLVKTLVRREGLWGLIVGGLMLAGALGWFVWVTGFLANSGDGVMTYRYKNFIYDGSGSLMSVVKAVLICPMKAVFECVDPEKLKFIGLTLGPLLALPLVTRRYERYILLIPYILVNLMSDYQYQHDIFFQYTYGATACLFYLTLVNLADIRLEKVRIIALAVALAVGIGCFSALVVPKAIRYPKYCIQYGDYYDKLRSLLDLVPEDASVAATTYYTTHLSQRDVLYDVRYASKEHLLSCEYIVLNVSDEKSFKTYGGFEGLIALLESEGYTLLAEYEGKLEIYRK